MEPSILVYKTVEQSTYSVLYKDNKISGYPVTSMLINLVWMFRTKF